MRPAEWIVVSPKYEKNLFPEAGRDIGLAAGGQWLPMLESEWSLLVVISLHVTSGFAWVTLLEGQTAVDEQVSLRKTKGTVPVRVARELCTILGSGQLSTMREPKNDVYYGAPTEIHIRRGDERRALIANACAPRRGRALRIARLVWHLVDEFVA